jgi:Protein of unknown function (DUF3617)
VIVYSRQGANPFRKKKKMHLRLILSLVFLSAPANFLASEELEPLLQGGSYEITHRLELPHVERWAIQKTATICLPEMKGSVSAALPVLSDNTPFGECTIVNIHRNGPSLSYDIKCPGRDSAKAHAAYTVSSSEFTGRVAMVMAAKNMTMTEVQVGQRVGSCDSTHAIRD